MTKHRLMLSAAAAALLAATASAHADTTITTSTSTALNTGSAGNIVIDATGGIGISAAGPSVNINSANTVTNNGFIANTGTNDSTGIQIDTTNGNIFPGATGFLSTGTIDLGGSGTGKKGIYITGGNTYYGPITLTTLTGINTTGQAVATQQSSLILKGDNSAGFYLAQGTKVTSNILLSGGGIIQNASDNSTQSNSIMVLLDGTVNGNVINTGGLSGTGPGMVGMQINGGIHSCASDTGAPTGFSCPTSFSGGSLINSGQISVGGTGFPSARGNNPQSGSALIIASSIDGGVLNAGPGTSSNVTAGGDLLQRRRLRRRGQPHRADRSVPVDQRVHPDAARAGDPGPRHGRCGSHRSGLFLHQSRPHSGPARRCAAFQRRDGHPGLQLGLFHLPGYLGQRHHLRYHAPYRHPDGQWPERAGQQCRRPAEHRRDLRRGQPPTSPAAPMAPSRPMRCISAPSPPSRAWTSRLQTIGGGSTTPGIISAEVNGVGQGNAIALTIAENANVPIINVGRGATISASVLTNTTTPTQDVANSNTPFSLASQAIVDVSGSVRQINNAGTIKAANTTLTPAAGTVVSNVQRSVDLSASTQGNTAINNSGTMLGDMLFSSAGNGNVLNVGNIGALGTANPATGVVNSPSNYATVGLAFTNQPLSGAPTAQAALLSFGSGTGHLLHVGGYGYVNADIRSGVGALDVQVDPNGLLFIANTTTSLQANNFNAAQNATVGLSISQANLNSLTPVVQANSANLSGANLALQFGTFISSGFTAASVAAPTAQTVTLIRAPVITDTTLAEQNAILGQNTPFLFESPRRKRPCAAGDRQFRRPADRCCCGCCRARSTSSTPMVRRA